MRLSLDCKNEQLASTTEIRAGLSQPQNMTVRSLTGKTLTRNWLRKRALKKKLSPIFGIQFLCAILVFIVPGSHFVCRKRLLEGAPSTHEAASARGEVQPPAGPLHLPITRARRPVTRGARAD